MRKILVVIDVQNDFVSGSLGTHEAMNIIPAVRKKIYSYPAKDIFYTLDTHGEDYMNTQEGKNLPIPHCIKGSAGWMLQSEIGGLLAGTKGYEKTTFGSIQLAKDITEIADRENIEIEIVGLCTDICVVSNALLLKAYMPEVKMSVDPACCAGVTPEKHQAALEVMRSCQIEIL